LGNFRSLSVALVCLLQHSAASIAAGALLYLMCWLAKIPFTSAYVSLALLAMMLVALFVSEQLTKREQIRLFSSYSYIGPIITMWVITVCILLVIGYATKMSATYSRLVLFSWFLLTPIAILIAQWALQEILAHLLEGSSVRRKVIIAGINPISKQLATNITTDQRLGMDLAGYFEDRSAERFGDLPHGQLLGKLADITSYVKLHNIDAIYVALPIGHLQSTREILDQLQDTTTSVYFVPDILVFDLIQSRIDDIHGVPVLALLETPFYGVNGVLKRAFDVIFSIAALIALFPVMLIIALGVRLSSPGPCLFKQRRYGIAGNEIVVYKFRTMTVLEDNNDNITQATEDDARFTRFGAWLRAHSLDELPQFVNVLQGRMSVVGPRPHAVAHNEMYRKLVKGYMIRHKVLPGITGWAQVNGFRGETKEVSDMKGRIQLDLEYLRKWSVSMDIKIILRTMGIVIKDNDAH
jgi:putative colanic acid biosynthesis UDP-glucose lipid carrier transferase